MTTTSTKPSRGRRLQVTATRFAFWLWVVAVSTIGATLLSAHWIALPKPDRELPELVDALNATRDAGEDERWLAVHVLYTDCPCSVRVIDHLVESQRPAAAVDKVILVGPPEPFEARLRERGFWVDVLTPHELERRYRIEAAPLFAVVGPRSLGARVEYLGGYTSRKQGPDIADIEIINELVAEKAVAEHPLYGCGVSAELQQILDPLGVKY